MKTRVLQLLALVSLGAPGVLGAASGPQVKLTREFDRIRVEIGDRFFTQYVFADGASRPYFHPVLARDGTPLTRDFPMKETPGEDTDHPWHRSMWFAHSFMSGVDFWNEGTGDNARSPKEKGRSEHLTLLETTSGKVGVIRSRNRWIGPDLALICTDERTIRFHPGPDGDFIDFEITLLALPDKPLVFGDNKDGTMAVRVAQWMTMPHKMQGKDTGGKGHIVTSRGKRDSAAWGTRAEWCDYNAERNGKVYGVAIFDHPDNLRHPTWWHVREYGLFGANPFGWHDFEKEFANDPKKGEYVVPPGGKLTLRYRLYFHTGDEKQAKLAERYVEYAKGT